MSNKFYDKGWNARVADKPFTTIGTTRDWRDGWHDCDDAPEAERVPMGDPPSLHADAWDEQLAAFRATMAWSIDATEDEKSMVHGNLNGFVAFLRANHFVLAGPMYPNSQED